MQRYENLNYHIILLLAFIMFLLIYFFITLSILCGLEADPFVRRGGDGVHAVEDARPILYLFGLALPGVDHDAPGRLRNVLLRAVDGRAVHIPGDGSRRPEERVFVERLRGVKAEIVEIFVFPHAVCVVIELHLRGVVAQEFNVDLIPGVVLARARIGEKGADDA